MSRTLKPNINYRVALLLNNVCKMQYCVCQKGKEINVNLLQISQAKVVRCMYVL